MLKNSRYLEPLIREELKDKMAIVGGPRQVGKTTMALHLLKADLQPPIQHPAYLNWDILKHKSLLMRAEIPARQSLVVLDEIHKFKRWRNLVKGLYDAYHPQIEFLITGSARLDHYHKGGDSLLGRYHYYRLHPFSLRELHASPKKSDLEGLLRFGGFPEPLFAANEKTWRRWQKERLQRIIYDDLRNLENVKEISMIELLLEALPARVGSPLSIKSLREDLEVSHQSIERWITILENLYVCFRISPYGSPKIRAVKKEQKLYFWDWSQSEDPGPRFENLVASQLLKYCHWIEDSEGFKMELRFLRDTDKREIDFVVLKDKKPLFAVECKSGEKSLAPTIGYFKARTSIPDFYQVHLGKRDTGQSHKTGRVLPWTTFCEELKMP